MCKYCDALMLDSGNIEGVPCDDMYLERIGATTCLYLYDHKSIPIQVNNCPWCGNNLNWAADGYSNGDANNQYLVVSTPYKDGLVYDADCIIGSYFSPEDFEDSIRHDFDMMHNHNDMWYYVIQPHIVAKYHQVAKIERCDK